MDIPPALVFLGMVSMALMLLLGLAGQTLMERRARLQRVRAAVTKRSSRGEGGGTGRGAQSWQTGALAAMKASTGRISIMKDRQIQETKRMLVSAGYRSRDAIVVFTFFKLVAPLAFAGGAAIYVFGLDPIGKGLWGDVGAVMLAALVGSKLPDVILKNKRDKRVDSIRKALPDSLDMLVICAQAGLASDASLKRVVAETSKRGSILSEELNHTALELSFMPQRRQALENLAERVPLPSIQAFTNTMIQAEKYGTPLAKAFRVLADEQRKERFLKAEEKAGRLPATMTVPMMMFILPALFIVLIGPAILDIMDNFIGMER
jgi:tight adherence protein C